MFQIVKIEFLKEVTKTMFQYFACLVVLYFAIKLLWRLFITRNVYRDSSSFSKSLKIPPGDFGLPVIGETIQWALQGKDFNVIRRNKFGNIFCTHIIGEPVVRVTGAANIKELLKGEHVNVTSKLPTSATKILGRHSILCSRGESHKRKSNALLKAFSHSALDGYIPLIASEIREKISKWQDSKEPVMVFENIKTMVVDLALNVLLGFKLMNSKDRITIKSRFDDFLNNLFSLPFEFPGFGFKKGMDARRTLHKILDKHIEEKRKKIQEQVNRKRDIISSSCPKTCSNALQYLIEDEIKEQERLKSLENDSDCSDLMDDRKSDYGNTLSSDELREISVELLAAGSQTNSSAMSSILHQLAQHPEVMKKLEEELKSHGILTPEQCEKHHDEAYMSDDENVIGSDEINLRTLHKLKYLDQVVKETLRLLSPVPGVYRRALKTFQLGNYIIPKGWSILYNITDTHAYEWEDAYSFNPDRFSEESWKNLRDNRYKWIPFGQGPRRCIGRDFARTTLKIFLIEVMRKYKSWEFTNGKPSPIFLIPLTHPTDGMPMKFHPR